jgi:hypothetical protein
MSTTKIKKMLKAKNRLGQEFKFTYEGEQMTGILTDAAHLDDEPHVRLTLKWRTGNPPSFWVPVREVEGL